MAPKYNKAAVDKQLKKDGVKKPGATKLTHKLLKGRQKTDEAGSSSFKSASKKSANRHAGALKRAQNWLNAKFDAGRSIEQAIQKFDLFPADAAKLTDHRVQTESRDVDNQGRTLYLPNNKVLRQRMQEIHHDYLVPGTRGRLKGARLKQHILAMDASVGRMDGMTGPEMLALLAKLQLWDEAGELGGMAEDTPGATDAERNPSMARAGRKAKMRKPTDRDVEKRDAAAGMNMDAMTIAKRKKERAMFGEKGINELGKGTIANYAIKSHGEIKDYEKASKKADRNDKWDEFDATADHGRFEKRIRGLNTAKAKLRGTSKVGTSGQDRVVDYAMSQLKKKEANKGKRGKRIGEDGGTKYGVFSKGGSIGSSSNDKPVSTHDTKEEAQAKARRMRKQLTKGERGYYKMSYVTRPIKESQINEGVLDDMDDDGFMAKRQLYDTAKGAVTLHKLIQDTDNLEPWIQAKLTKAADYIETVKHYLEYQGAVDADDTANAIGMDDIAGIETAMGPDPMAMPEEAIVEEEEGTLDGFDILRMAHARQLISHDTYDNPTNDLFNVADAYAEQLGELFEIGSSDVSIFMKEFARNVRDAGLALDGERAHVYVSEAKASKIYNKMMSGLKGK